MKLSYLLFLNTCILPLSAHAMINEFGESDVEKSSVSATLNFSKSRTIQGMEDVSKLGGQNPSGIQLPKGSDDTVATVKTKLRAHLKENPAILNSSQDKDIVVFLGNTGAGKSTLINYLSEKALEVDHYGHIILKSGSNELEAMAIGVGNKSETFFPRCIQVDGLLLYDLPGFKGTTDTDINVVNARFIQEIVEKAKSVKLVFVVGMDEVDSDRGTSFNELLFSVERLIPNQTIKGFSSLVITKSDLKRESLSEYLLGSELLLMSNLLENEKLVEGKVYLKKEGNKLKYTIVTPGDREIEENLDININEDLTDKVLSIFEDQILKETSKRGDSILGVIAKPTPILKYWLESNQISQMSSPDKKNIKQSDRNHILGLIKNTKAQKITNVDIGVVYNEKDKHIVEKIYIEEIQENIDLFIEDSLDTLDIGTLEEKKEYLKNLHVQVIPSLVSSLLDKSELIQLLRPISVDIYNRSLGDMEKTLQDKISQKLVEIEFAIKDEQLKDLLKQKDQAESAKNAVIDSLDKALHAEKVEKKKYDSLFLENVENTKTLKEIREAREIAEKKKEELDRENVLIKHKNEELEKKATQDKEKRDETLKADMLKKHQLRRDFLEAMSPEQRIVCIQEVLDYWHNKSLETEKKLRLCAEITAYSLGLTLPATLPASFILAIDYLVKDHNLHKNEAVFPEGITLQNPEFMEKTVSQEHNYYKCYFSEELRDSADSSDVDELLFTKQYIYI